MKKILLKTMSIVFLGTAISYGIYFYVDQFKTDNKENIEFVVGDRPAKMSEILNADHSKDMATFTAFVNKTLKDYHAEIDRVFDLDSYATLISEDKKTKFDDLTDIQKILFMSVTAEKYNLDLYNIYQKVAEQAMIVSKHNGNTFPDKELYDLAYKFFSLASDLAQTHIEYISNVDGMQLGNNKVTLTDVQKKQFAAYKDKLVKQYQKRGML